MVRIMHQYQRTIVRTKREDTVTEERYKEIKRREEWNDKRRMSMDGRWELKAGVDSNITLYDYGLS